MDIWRWVVETETTLIENGQIRLAEIIDELSHAVCDGRHARVDALVPEALALARAAEQPWLEVFIRHWNLQSLIFHRYQVKDALPEAVRLLDFASQETTRDCPQSICVTQDLTQCYAQLDGPGFVQERIEAARETLERIDPTWPCYVCISGEYAGALCDDRRFEEVLEFVAETRQRLAAAGKDQPGAVLGCNTAPALMALGRFSEALEEAERWDVSLSGEHSAKKRDLLCALALARMERFSEALERMLSADKVLEMGGNYVEWARCVRELFRAGALEIDWDTHRALWTMYRGLVDHGARYSACDLAKIAAEIAIARQARVSTELWIASARELLGELRAADHLRARLDDLEQQLPGSADEEPEAGLTPDALIETLGRDPETELDVIVAARKRSPDHQELACMHARALRTIGRHAMAEEVLHQFIASHAEAQDALETLAEILLSSQQHDALLAILGDLGDPLPPHALWLRALSERDREELDACAATLDLLLAELSNDSDSAGHGPAHELLVEVERKRGNLERALSLLDTAVEHSEPGNIDWDRMVLATILGQWSKVHHSAGRLELPVNTDEDQPIDEDWGLCMIRFDDEAKSSVQIAQRTGPVSARVLQMAGPGRIEHYLDHVVFEPAPLNPPPDPSAPDADAGHQRQLLIYQAVHVLQSGGRTCYSLDGVHPGESALEPIIVALRDRDIHVSVRSDEQYQLMLPEPENADDDSAEHDSEPVPGLYAFLAIAEDADPQPIHALLRELTRDLPHPLVWLELAAALDDSYEVARQRAIAERYEL